MRTAALLGLLTLCAACSALPEQYDPPIPAAVIINTVKCDLAQYLEYEGEHLGPPFILRGGKAADVKLTLNVVDERAQGGGVDLDIGSILPFKGASLDFGFSDSLTRTSTIERVVDLQFTPDARNTSICRRVGKAIMANGVGLYTFLVTTRNDIEHAKHGEPLVLVDKLSYSTSFGVERKTTEQGNFGFVPVKASFDSTQKRSDLQKIEVSFTTKKHDPKPKKKKVAQKKDSCDSRRESCPTAGGKVPSRLQESDAPPTAPMKKPSPRRCDPTRETCPFAPPAAEQ